MFVTTKVDPNPGKLLVYRAATRNEDGTFVAPEEIREVQVGYGPDNILTSSVCSIVATANEGEAVCSNEEGLVNPPGSVSIIRGPFGDPATPPSHALVSLNKWNDEELIAKDIHLKLSKNTMIYWNNSVDISVDFDQAISTYSSDMNLEPECLAWGAGETTILANLQENNGLVVVDLATNDAVDIFS